MISIELISLASSHKLMIICIFFFLDNQKLSWSYWLLSNEKANKYSTFYSLVETLDCKIF